MTVDPRAVMTVDPADRVAACCDLACEMNAKTADLEAQRRDAHASAGRRDPRGQVAEVIATLPPSVRSGGLDAERQCGT